MPTGTSQPYGDSGIGELWFKVTSTEALATNRKTYIGDIYRNPFNTATKVNDTTTVKALNVKEVDATTTNYQGIGLNPSSTNCGDFTDVKALPVGSMHKVFGRYSISGTWHYAIIADNELNQVPPDA